MVKKGFKIYLFAKFEIQIFYRIGDRKNVLEEAYGFLPSFEFNPTSSQLPQGSLPFLCFSSPCAFAVGRVLHICTCRQWAGGGWGG